MLEKEIKMPNSALQKAMGSNPSIGKRKPHPHGIFCENSTTQ
jgi:hypothetical protein